MTGFWIAACVGMTAGGKRQSGAKGPELPRQHGRRVCRGQPAWYLQLDIRNYFMSIDKPVLFDMLAAKMSGPDALWLTR